MRCFVQASCAGAARRVSTACLIIWASGGAICAIEASAAPISTPFGFRYKDANDDPIRVRKALVRLFDSDAGSPGLFRQIGPNGAAGPFPELRTWIDGVAQASVDHTVGGAAGEANGFDIQGRVTSDAKVGGWTAKVFDSDGTADEKPNNLYGFESAIQNNVVAAFGAPVVETRASRANLTSQAFAVLDPIVTGMYYAQRLAAPTTDIEVVFPRSQAAPGGLTDAERTAWLQERDDSAYMQKDGAKYRITLGANHRWNWDVALHEYGHTVAAASKFDGSAGGHHVINGDSANKELAFSEGYANYFQSAAQDWENRFTDDNRLPDASCARPASGKIRGTIKTMMAELIGTEWSYDIDANKGEVRNRTAGSDAGRPTGEKSELAISRVLWDLMDGDDKAEGEADEVTLGHKGLHDLLTKIHNPGAAEADRRPAHTITEFRKVVQDSGADAAQKMKLARVFAEQECGPMPVKAKKIGGVAPAPASAPAAPRPHVPFTGGLIVPDSADTAGGAAQGTRRHGDFDPDAPSMSGSFPTPDLAIPVISPESADLALEWMGLAGLNQWNVQFFVGTGSLMAPFASSDDSGPTDTPSDAEALDLVAMLGGVTGLGGPAPELGDHAVALSAASMLSTDSGTMSWSSVLASIAGTPSQPTFLTWNVVGYDFGQDAGLDGVWGSAMKIAVIPTPGATALLAMAGLCVIRRSRLSAASA